MFKLSFRRLILLAMAAGFGLAAGCTSYYGDSYASGSMYYGTGFYDPWYYGNYDEGDIIITPPPGSPTRPPDGAHPAHPIVRPPAGAHPAHPIARPPAARPMPSIPSAPRGGARPARGR